MIDILGMEYRNHAGVKAEPLPTGANPHALAYSYTRRTHDWLTDTNHVAAIVVPPVTRWFSHVMIYKTAEAPYFAFNPARLDDGEGARWFDQEFRVATVSMLLEEMADQLKRGLASLAEAGAARDTVRGRKARRRAMSLVSEFWRQSRVIASRYPLCAPIQVAMMTADRQLDAPWRVYREEMSAAQAKVRADQEVEIEAAERRELARLKAKYEGAGHGM